MPVKEYKFYSDNVLIYTCYRNADKLKLKQDDRENLNDCEQQNYNKLARTYSC